ncbi:MAG: carboxypeptidase regulatory-like domain-containing protein, partial [Bacteroidetes bacterium]|nr:carboxypeptidase regulatory-like domain-containing protein [Bacteroidota bacterium]
MRPLRSSTCLRTPQRARARARFSILMVTLSSFFLCSAAFCQTGGIRGRVTDAETDAQLPGANVIVRAVELGRSDSVETAGVRGAATDGEGRFAIDGLSAGSYTVRVS